MMQSMLLTLQPSGLLTLALHEEARCLPFCLTQAAMLGATAVLSRVWLQLATLLPM